MSSSGESGDYCLQIWKQETHKLLQMVETLFYFLRVGQHLLVGACATAAPVAPLVSERSMASLVGVPISREKYKKGHHGRWQGSPLLSEGRPTSPPLRQLPQCFLRGPAGHGAEAGAGLLPITASEPSWGGSRCVGWGCCL